MSTCGDATAISIRSVICVPILEFTGEPIGAINLDSKSRYTHFTREDLDVLMIVAGQIAFSLQYARLLEKLLDEHRHRFDKEVRHVLHRDRDLEHGALAREAQHLGREVEEAILDPSHQHDGPFDQPRNLAKSVTVE